MMSLYTVVPLLALVSCVVLIVGVVTRRSADRLRGAFVLGVLGFAAEAAITLTLQLEPANPEAQRGWLRILYTLGLVSPIPWGLVLLDCVASRITATSRRRRWLGVAAAALVVLAFVATAAVPPFRPLQPSAAGGLFQPAALTAAGRFEMMALLLPIVAILGGLEAALRASRQGTRWRIKYTVLGLGSIFAARFLLVSACLVLEVLPPVYLLIEVATVFVGNLLIAVSLLRGDLLGMKMTISRQFLYNSIVVAVAGTYLLVIGILGWTPSWLGVAEKSFWSSLAVLASSLGLAIFLLSEDVRWRAKRFLSRHFYASKYDYRDQWISFTKRLGSLVTVEELAPELVSAIVDAVGTTKGALYLFDSNDTRYHLACTIDIGYLPDSLQADSTLIELVQSPRRPAVLSRGGHRWEGLYHQQGWTSFADVAVAVPLSWQGTLTGILLIGPERTGAAYSSEDIEFLATVAEQAAGAIVTTRLSEALTHAREFDAFHRMTSFVVHDLKNAVAALSLLSRNALDHFDDPAFQRDALRTLSKTVGRMQRLMERLVSASAPSRLNLAEVDLPALLQELAEPLVAGKRVTVDTQLEPVAPILADREAIEQALQHLLTNAIEAMGGEGRVTLRSELRDGQVVCMVSDTGCGIPREFLQNSLFVPFQTTKRGGWGLGLYQVREIVTAHHGQMTVESEEGKGTTLTLLFPPSLAGQRAAVEAAS
jgi:putative PEP-CTERM system histidine kinase